MNKIKILLADDQTLISQSFKIMLESRDDNLEVVGIANDGNQVLEFLETVTPDIILMDVRMPHLDGVETTKIVRERYPQIRVVMLTTYDDDNYVHNAIAYGAAGYLLKDISMEELIPAIQMVMKGMTLIARRTESSEDRRLVGANEKPGPQAENILHDLTHKEIEILKQIARGSDNKDIALQFHMAEQSVKNLVSRIYVKIGVETRKDARKIALGLGLVGWQEL